MRPKKTYPDSNFAANSDRYRPNKFKRPLFHSPIPPSFLNWGRRRRQYQHQLEEKIEKTPTLNERDADGQQAKNGSR